MELSGITMFLWLILGGGYKGVNCQNHSVAHLRSVYCSVCKPYGNHFSNPLHRTRFMCWGMWIWRCIYGCKSVCGPTCTSMNLVGAWSVRNHMNLAKQKVYTELQCGSHSHPWSFAHHSLFAQYFPHGNNCHPNLRPGNSFSHYLILLSLSCLGRLRPLTTKSPTPPTAPSTLQASSQIGGISILWPHCLPLKSFFLLLASQSSSSP